jgi:hypothetical protein
MQNFFMETMLYSGPWNSKALKDLLRRIFN